MIIWAIALLLAASLAFAGWCFGVIRAAITFVGLFISLLAARIFAHTVTPLFAHVGVKDPVLAYKPKKGPETDPRIMPILNRGMTYVDEWAQPGGAKPAAEEEETE